MISILISYGIYMLKHWRKIYVVDKSKNKIMNVVIPMQLFYFLKVVSRRENIPVSRLINYAISSYVNDLLDRDENLELSNQYYETMRYINARKSKNNKKR